MRRTPKLILVVLSSALGGCGGSAKPAQEPTPLVHGFSRADEWAKEFDDPSRDSWQKPSAILEAMELEQGMTVADIGAGTGYFEGYLSHAVGHSGVVLALDIEPDMIDHLTKRAAHEQWENVKPTQVKVDDPELAAGSVDRVLIVDTWHHIPDRAAYATKLAAALAPKGTVTIVDFTPESDVGPPPEHRVSVDQVVSELLAGGLQATVIEEELPKQYMVVGRK